VVFRVVKSCSGVVENQRSGRIMLPLTSLQREYGGRILPEHFIAAKIWNLSFVLFYEKGKKQATCFVWRYLTASVDKAPYTNETLKSLHGLWNTSLRVSWFDTHVTLLEFWNNRSWARHVAWMGDKKHIQKLDGETPWKATTWKIEETGE